jgi:3-deoxy-D-manno-octulosonic-acid transferase
MLGLKQQEKVLVAASTHPGEEKIILDAYERLLAQFPYLRLMIAPRHPERAGGIEKLIVSSGFSAAKISRLESATAAEQNVRIIFILDTIGELVSFYAVADIVFVGGSLTKNGGHNILEPASLAKPILFGPHMFNFRDIADLFLKNKAAIMVSNPQELEINIIRLLNDPSEAAKMGMRGREAVLESQGATNRNLECIRKIIASS